MVYLISVIFYFSKRFLTFRDVKNGKQSSLVGDCKIVVTTKKENVCNISEGYLSKEVLRNSLIESDNSLDISAISGVPEGLFEARRVRIFMPAKNSMQSGTNDCHHWLLGMIKSFQLFFIFVQ